MRVYSTITEQELRAFRRERLAGYMGPKLIAFHASLPREDAGKGPLGD